MTAEQIGRMEDRHHGRSIPGWRYELAYLLILMGLVFARVSPDGIWRGVGAYFVTLVSYRALIRPYRQRTFY